MLWDQKHGIERLSLRDPVKCTMLEYCIERTLVLNNTLFSQVINLTERRREIILFYIGLVTSFIIRGLDFQISTGVAGRYSVRC